MVKLERNNTLDCMYNWSLFINSRYVAKFCKYGAKPIQSINKSTAYTDAYLLVDKIYAYSMNEISQSIAAVHQHYSEEKCLYVLFYSKIS